MKQYIKTVLSAIGAGIAIAIGGTIYLTLENKIVGSLMFTVGLYTIVLNGLALYTGRVGYIIEAENRKGYLISLTAVWLGNLIGTSVGAILINATRIFSISQNAAVISEIKLLDDLPSILILSVFCGMLMYIAVDGYKQKGNPAILFICVSVFILCGFEHCIANMFYFSVAGAWSLKAVGYLLVMTVGNSIGGILIPLIKKYSK